VLAEHVAITNSEKSSNACQSLWSVNTLARRYSTGNSMRVMATIKKYTMQ